MRLLGRNKGRRHMRATTLTLTLTLWLCPKVVVDSKVHQNNYNAVYTLKHSYSQPAGSEAGASSQTGTLGGTKDDEG